MADDLQTNSSQTLEPESPAISPALRDKRKLPEGVVPKQAQGYVVAGLAVLILMAVMFSKNHPRPTAKETAATPGAVATDANQRKIQELEQDLSATQRQSQQQTAALRTGSASPATTDPGGESFTTRRCVSCFTVAAACSRFIHRTATRSHCGCGESDGLQGPLRIEPRRCRRECCALAGHDRYRLQQ